MKNRRQKTETVTRKHYNLRPRKSKTHVNTLPNEIIGQILGEVPVVSRLQAARVSRRWKWVVGKFGWTKQRKLDRESVFEGATPTQISRFTGENLVSLLESVGENLMELDFHSFGYENLKRFVPKIAKSLKMFPRLEKLNIKRFKLSNFVNNLPETLRELETSGEITIQTLEALSRRCPNLEQVPFKSLPLDIDFDTIVELIGKFPRQKNLELSIYPRKNEQKIGAFATIGQLKELEGLFLWRCEALDVVSFEAIVGGCQRLRKFFFSSHRARLPEQTLFQLAKMPSLTVLNVFSVGGDFSDAVLKAIAQRGQLKELSVYGYKSETLTDNAVEYLVDRCKALVSLAFYECPKITERSLEAVIAEVQRRHGTTPRTLPTDHRDPGVFYFSVGSEKDRVWQLINDNHPWLEFGYDFRTHA